MHCPNQFCAPNTTAVDLEAAATDGWQAPPLKYVAEGMDAKDTTAEYKTAVWTYEWPQSAETWHQKQQKEQADGDAAAQGKALAFVVGLGADGLLTEGVEQKLVARLSGGDAALVAATAAYSTGSASGGDARLRAARILSSLALA